MDAVKKVKIARQLLKEVAEVDLVESENWRRRYERLTVEWDTLRKEYNKILPGGSTTLLIAELNAEIAQRGKRINELKEHLVERNQRINELEGTADGPRDTDGPDLQCGEGTAPGERLLP